MSMPNRLPAAPKATDPSRPTNALHTAGNAISTVVGAPMMAVDKLNEGFATVTAGIASAFPAFPAATLGSIAFGAPHAHIAHPPSIWPPAPAIIPFPPIGPVTLGCSVQVLINNKPAARAGDIGLSPTCCGIIGMYEIKTGSSNVFLGGGRAARMLDFSHHCTPAASGVASRAQKAGATATKAAKLAASASKVIAVGTKVMIAGGMAAQGLNAAGDYVESTKVDNAAISGALALNASMLAAQMAMDAAAMAAAAAMGKDQPMVPPTGTIGTILSNTSPNVLIGGFPMPPWLSIAKGFMKLVKGLRKRPRNGQPRNDGPGADP
ncbi:MAG: PAAR domain-containing protein [Mariniblastus sp.]